MINFSPIFYIVGIFLSTLSATMILPLGLDLFYDDPNWLAFLMSMVAAGTIGIVMTLANKPIAPIELTVRQAFLLTTLSWVILCLGSSLPFILSRSTDTDTDSIFEAVSALTSTGATILEGLEYSSPGILLWRSILQWLGGIGIIVMALTVLPILQIGGMQLFRSEFSDRSEKILPKVSQIAAAIFLVYSGFSVLCMLLLWGAGMGFLEAVCHGMTIVATGGFSTADSSIAYFESALIEFIAIIFMIIGGSTLILFVRMLRGNFQAFWKDTQIQTYFALIVITSCTVTLWLWLHSGYDFPKALRESTFNVVSILTTSGFSNGNYAKWEIFPLLIIFMVMFLGGCTGSTSGGIKIFRFQIIYTLAQSQLYRLRHPRGIFIPMYKKQTIREGIFDSVFTYLALFGLTTILLILGLAMFDLDFVTCLSGAVAAVSNVGPGLGEIIGPAGNYASLPEGSKWLLMMGMLLGRLEFMTILILFTPVFWKR